MWADNKFAFDRSARQIDADGRLHVEKSHISKAVVNPYYGKEIPGYQDLGLDPEKIYRLYRDPVELERAAPTFARLPILSEHVPVTVENPRPDLVVGAIGSNVSFNAPYLDADTCIWENNAIAGIETGAVREFSCAYRYKAVMEPGVSPDGQAYDGRMTEIQGNHLALVEVGRAGSDVVVADHNPFINKELTMKMTKLGKALFTVLGVASPKLAADSALPALVGAADRKSFDRKGVSAKLVAMDATLSPQQLDNVIDALLDVEQEPEPVVAQVGAGDGSPVEKLRALLAGKVDDAVIEEACGLLAAPAADEFPEKEKEGPGMKKEEVNAAMDAYGQKLREEMKQTFEACREVRPVVGDVLGMDSAREVYEFALDHMKIDHKDVDSVPALRALFKVAAAGAQAPAPAVAQDSAGLLQKFPQVARFGRV